MKKTDLIKSIAGLLKLDETKLNEALSADAEKEIGIALPEVTVFTAEELTALHESKINEGKKEGSKNGELQGKELLVKELKKAFGVEFEGKDPIKFKEAIVAQFAKGDDGLKERIKELEVTLQTKEKEVEATKKQAETAVFDSGLLSSFPSSRKPIDKGGFTDSEYLVAIKNNLSFELLDGVTIVKKGGTIMQDPKTFKPIPVSDAITSYFSERKWVDEAKKTGRGGEDDNAFGKAMKLSDATKAWEAEGKNVASAEFQQHVTALAKENPDFIFD